MLVNIPNALSKEDCVFSISYRVTPQNASQDKEESPSEPPKVQEYSRLTVRIRKEVLEKCKNAVYWTQGLTLCQLVEDSILEYVRRLEDTCLVTDTDTGKCMKAKGDRFPSRPNELKAGRPIK